MRVMQELVYQTAVSVLNVIAPNTHTMPTSCSQIWGNLIFQLLENKLAMCPKHVFSSSEIFNDRAFATVF